MKYFGNFIFKSCKFILIYGPHKKVVFNFNNEKNLTIAILNMRKNHNFSRILLNELKKCRTTNKDFQYIFYNSSKHEIDIYNEYHLNLFRMFFNLFGS